MSEPLRTLVIEDVEDDALLLVRELRRGGYAPLIARVDTPEAMRAALDGQEWDVILSDFFLPRFDAPAALRLLQDMGHDIPFIIVSGSVGDEAAVRAMRAGAHDYLIKDNLARLVPAVRREVHEAANRRAQRATEGERARLARHLHLLLDSTAEGIYGLDTAGRCTFINRAACAMLGYKLDEVLGQPLHAILQPRRADGSPYPVAGAPITRAYAEGVDCLVEDEVWWRRDGSSFAVSYAAHPIVEEGERLGAVVSFVDITERKRAEEERTSLLQAERAARAEAQEAIHMRDTFLSVASHELKTPITTLQGYAGLLRRRLNTMPGLDERSQRAITIIYDQSVRLNKLVDMLLDISRLHGGQLSIQREALELGELVERLVQEAQPSLDQHRIELQRPPRPLWVQGDALRLEQVLQNLLQNALKYSPAGGTITVKLDATDGQVACAITDQGIGIPEAELPLLFGRFFRGSNVTSAGIQGAGLGLYVVNEIVTLHGGAVHVASREHEGSTFTLTLRALENKEP